jgi:4-oxalocrotonate tautomerase
MVPMGIPDHTTLTERSLEDRMPYVNIKVTREGVTTEQKERLIKGATDLLVEVLGKKPATIFVVIDEVDTDNWGVAGESITVRRNRGQ